MERAKNPKDESSGIKVARCEMSYNVNKMVLNPLKLQHTCLLFQKDK